MAPCRQLRPCGLTCGGTTWNYFSVRPGFSGTAPRRRDGGLRPLCGLLALFGSWRSYHHQRLAAGLRPYLRRYDVDLFFGTVGNYFPARRLAGGTAACALLALYGQLAAGVSARSCRQRTLVVRGSLRGRRSGYSGVAAVVADSCGGVLQAAFGRSYGGSLRHSVHLGWHVRMSRSGSRCGGGCCDSSWRGLAGSWVMDCV